MQRTSLPIGIFARNIGGYYFGAMLNSIHQVARQAGVPLLVIQGGLQDLQLPTFGAKHVAGWIVIHPMDGDSANPAALVATGVPVVTVATAPSRNALCLPIRPRPIYLRAFGWIRSAYARP
jgi:DNA-binding LacI/PurR family transcriptional regulator